MWDPNEPDWSDSLPGIYRSVYPDDQIEWLDDDSGVFSELDQELLKELESEHGVPSELIMKMLEVELSMNGLARRRGLLNKLRGLLSRDWQSLEDVQSERSKSDQRSAYRQKIEELTERHEALAS